MSRLLSYRIGSLANWPLKLLGSLLVLLSVVVSFQHLIGAIIMLIVGMAITTASYGVQIKPEDRTYREYMFLLGFKFGKWESFNKIEKIFVNLVTESETIYSRANRGYTIKKRKLAAFLKFNEDSKVKLYVEDDKGILMKKLNRIAEDLSIPITDNSTTPD